jgi:low temperature requirement protein LtrA
MVARDATEHHRVATPLELFFDLCFVVAVAQAAGRLHHDLSAGHTGHGTVSYVMVFFAIWWAWMNFTWFASAYDTDDDVYRITTLVQITGVLVLAAGVAPAADHGDYRAITFGYVIMRMGLVGQWLRAAHGDPPRRPAALRFAAGIAVLQIGWVGRLLLPAQPWGLVSFVALGVLELAVPIWSERAARTTWHPHHILERYGLFTLIVLGESVLAATSALQSAFGAGRSPAALLTVAAGGLVTVFSMWWLYFDSAGGPAPTTTRSTIGWGYGHYLVFASAAAVGAGLSVAVDHAGRTAGYAVAVPVAVYLLSVWALRILPRRGGPVGRAVFPVGAALILATPFTPAPVPLTALAMVAVVATDLLLDR